MQPVRCVDDILTVDEHLDALLKVMRLNERKQEVMQDMVDRPDNAFANHVDLRGR